MAYNGFKGHENGKQNGSHDKDRSSSDSSEVDGFCVVRNLFPKVRTVEDATDGTRLVTDKGTMSAAFKKRDQQTNQKKESKKIQHKFCKEKQKTEKDQPQNAPSIKRESQDTIPIEDEGVVTTKQPKLSKPSKADDSQKMCAVLKKFCKETQTENDKPQSKQVDIQKDEGKALIDTYPKAPIEGLPGFSQSAIMQDINLCDKCDCTQEEQPCMQCRGYNWHCQGTCTCCEVQRNLEEAMKDIE